MKFKQVAALERVTAWTRRKAWRRVFHPILVARIAASILMLPQTVGADDGTALNPPLAPRLDALTAQSTETLLSSVYRTQNKSGLYAPDDEGAALISRPIFATMAFDAWSATHNTAMLANSANSISRYYSYLFTSADRDGDRLVETPAMIEKRETRIEDPAFNALLAIDARNLARINLELRRTMQALYWYDGARSVERAVVAGTFDAASDFCFTRDPGSGQFIRRVVPGAALPAQFTLVVGSNHATRMRAHVVGWASQAVVNVVPADRATNAIDFLSAVSVLSDGAHAPVIEGLRSSMPGPSVAATTVERYALARSRVDFALTTDDVAFGLLLSLQRNAAFSDAERFRIEQALPRVQALAFAPITPSIALDEADAAIRTVYTTVGVLREQLRKSAFFGPEERKAYPGVDAGIAAQRLLDDVTMLVQRAENRAFEMRFAAAGLRMQAELVNDNVVAQDPITVHWETSAANAAVNFKTISVGIYGEGIAPLSGGPFASSPRAPLRFATRHVARGATGMLRLVTFTAVFESAPGVASRYHVARSVYLGPPVAVAARFPEGRTMSASTVPVQVVVRRNATRANVTKYFWFSPSGLRVTEGNTGLIRFGESDSAVVTLHVEVPAPCRPGVFPFTLKFFTGDRDAGTVTSSLFKPYQWTFVGPFAADGGLDVQHAPERGVNLLQSYPGPNGAAMWRPVPESACDPRGGISLKSLADDRGVQYLYTIVACAYETDVEARLFANAPAALYVNGRNVLAITSARGDSAAAHVRLDPDRNHILVKVIGDRDARVSFALGNDDNLAADEFDNNLAELAGGYREMTARELATGSPVGESRRLVTLHFQYPEATSVAVVGSFNGWSPASNPMRKLGDVWELTLSLAPGRYSYRFVVDQKKHVLDPASRTTEPDGYGGKNSVLVVNK